MLRNILDYLQGLDEADCRALVREAKAFSDYKIPPVEIEKKIVAVDLRSAEYFLEQIVPKNISNAIEKIMAILQDTRDEMRERKKVEASFSRHVHEFEPIGVEIKFSARAIQGFMQAEFDRTLFAEGMTTDANEIARLIRNYTNLILFLDVLAKKLPKTLVNENAVSSLHKEMTVELTAVEESLQKIYKDKLENERRREHDASPLTVAAGQEEKAVTTRIFSFHHMIKIERRKIRVEGYLQHLWDEIHSIKGADYSKVGQAPQWVMTDHLTQLIQSNDINSQLLAKKWIVAKKLHEKLCDPFLTTSEILRDFSYLCQTNKETLMEHRDQYGKTHRGTKVLDVTTFGVNYLLRKGWLFNHSHGEKLLTQMDSVPVSHRRNP